MKILPVIIALSALSLPHQASAGPETQSRNVDVPAITYINLPLMTGTLKHLHLTPSNRLLHHVSQCTKGCEIVYRHCKAVGAPNCENNYNVCMNSCA